MPPPASALKDSKPWPAYFLVRTTGEVVPLIAVDELPPGLNILGVPRAIDLEDTVGMLNLGLSKGTGVFYSVSGYGNRGTMSIERENKAPKTIDQFPSTHKVSYSGSTTPPDSTIPPNSPPRNAHNSPEPTSPLSAPSPKASPPSSSSSPSPPVVRRHVNDNDSIHVHTHSHSSNTTQLQHEHQLQSSAQTQLCRHWCHHGICKWGQQCRYRHIMPMTLSGLQEVGLADWPSWYRELNPGYFVSEMMGSAHPHAHAMIKGKGHRRGRVLMSGDCCDGRSHVHGAPCHHIPSRMAAGRGIGASLGSNAGHNAERLRTGTRVVVKDSVTSRVMRSDELGEQTIARLKNMEKEVKAAARVKQEREKITGSANMERAQARATRKWEDESESEATEGGDEGESGSNEILAAAKMEGKLVEV